MWQKVYQNTVLHRAYKCCDENNINLLRYVVHKQCNIETKLRLKCHLVSGADDVMDSINTLLENYSSENRSILNNMLKAF